MARDPYKYFRVEARELTDQMSRAVLDLEKGASPDETLQGLLRLAHTLKGAARVVRQAEIADASHAMEAALIPHRDIPGAVPTETINTLLGFIDTISKHISILGAAKEEVPDTVEKIPEEVFQSVRANTADMETLLNGVTEACVQVGALRTRLSILERAGMLSSLLGEQLAGDRDAKDANRSTLLKSRSIADELSGLLLGLERDSAQEVDRLDAELRQLRETIEHLRLLPAGVVFTPLERIARSTANTARKRVAFEGVGGEVRVDAELLASLQGGLIQLVRNAVVHGIETEAERAARAKPAVGKVVLRVTRTGQRIVFACSDDGAGINLARVRTAAEKIGALAKEQPLDPQAVLGLIMRSGLTTVATASDVSGRGVGLDVVREIAARFNGEVRLQSEPGKGTTIEIAFPLSLSSIDALLVEAGAGGAIFAIPTESIRRTVRLSSLEIVRSSDSEVISFDEQLVPFLPLQRAVSPASEVGPRKAWSIVVIEVKGVKIALGVDRMAGISRLVLRPLPDLVGRMPALAGAALSAEGDPLLVVDPEGVLAFAHQAPEAERSPAKLAPILVIDDSLTTRMLEQSILESAGYEVEVAVSGEEGMEKARSKSYALFLVDVEMPGMDGFTFVEQTRKDGVLRQIPAILVTSRSAPEDRKRGADAGASAYFIKSEFNQGDFLQRIRELVR